MTNKSDATIPPPQGGLTAPGEVPGDAEAASSSATPPPPAKPKWVKSQMPGDLLPAPLYIIGDADDIDEIDKVESGVYYVLASTEVSTTTSGTGNSSTVNRQVVPALYKRIRKLDGNGLVRVTDGKRAGLGQVKEIAYKHLPPMPKDFIDRIEYFFRQVDEEAFNGSEAIVILGFDRNFIDTENASEGWVCLVPEQTNTAAHCKYEPDSIMDEKADDVMIVGTIHSHPGMSAYASHTDVGDQFDNDGLHITIGWKGQATEYHCEYQMGNRRFDLKPEDCFEVVPKGTYDVSDWMGKVKKYSTAPNYRSAGSAGSAKTGGSGSQRQGSAGGGSADDPASRIFGEWYRSKHNKDRPNGCPDILENVVIAIVDLDDEKCPVCSKEFDRFSARNRRCTGCYTYLSLVEDDGDLTKILDERKEAYKNMVYMPGLEFMDNPKFKSKFVVLLWDPKATNQKDKVRCIYTPNSGIMGSGLGKTVGATA